MLSGEWRGGGNSKTLFLHLHNPFSTAVRQLVLKRKNLETEVLYSFLCASF